MQRLISDLILELSSAKRTSFLFVDDRNFSDDDYISWSGWTLDLLKSVTLLIASRMQTSKHRSPFEVVCLFWKKLKTNLSFGQIGRLFKIDTQEAIVGRLVKDIFHTVLANLKETPVL